MTDIKNNDQLLNDEEAVVENNNEVATEEQQVEAVANQETKESDEADSVVRYESKAEVMNRLKDMIDSEDAISRQETDALKSTFYKLHKQQQEAEYEEYIKNGGAPEEYQPAANDDEAEFKALMNTVREKRAAQHEEELKMLEENYNKKVAIIDKIKEILSKPDEVNRSYSEIRTLQQEWNDIKQVPAEKATDLWKTYQQNIEQFYDTLKLNNEFRAYDFKKNLELKTELCKRAEQLCEEEDVISAFRALQQLHQEFREIGPVERDLREEIWNRFKAASTIVNKRHQDYFESRKEQEQQNLEKKTALCEQVENFDLESLHTFADWNDVSSKIIELQAEWKTIGYAPQKMNVKIFERFRESCDNFFTKKTEFFKNVRESLNNNLKQKLELCEKAEAAKDSTDWKKTTDLLQSLQKQWREIGTVPKKYSDEIWKRFNAACDAFFAAKKEANHSQHAEQIENLQKKQAIIDELKAIDPATETDDYRDRLRDAQERWNQIGHVPFKEKENIYKALREQMDRLYGALNEHAVQKRISRFKSEVKDNDGKVKEKLLRQYDILKNEIKTYENNLGFLTLSSKSKNGNQLVNELNRKVDKLRSDLNEIQQKLDALSNE